MKQTLFVIEPWLFEGPLLIGWLIVGLVIFGFLYFKHGFKRETIGFVPVFLVVAAVIHFVLPAVMIEGTNPEDPNGDLIPIGLAIRGYGLMMLLAMVSGFGLVVIRSNQCRLNTDQILSLAFWMIVCGIIGARLFYVYQKYDQFRAESFSQSLLLMVDMTKGGLVVYGSFIGSMLAALVFCLRTKIKFWLTADILVPALLLGLGIGRIGCLLNGCCYGGACSVDWAAVRFPAGSPPYMRHLETGELIGLTTRPTGQEKLTRVVESVQPESLAAELGIQQGERIHIAHAGERVFRDGVQRGMDLESAVVVWAEGAPDRHVIDLDQFRSEPLNYSRPIHPTQIYSAVNAVILAVIAWYLFPFRRRSGDVLGIMVILYAVTRFLLEYVRTDEAPVDPFGWFTVSQWVSVTLVVAGIVILAAARYRPVAVCGPQNGLEPENLTDFPSKKTV